MLHKLIATESDDYSALVARVFLGIIIIPHGLQKMFGWFGGGGIEGTTAFFASLGLPSFVVYLVMIAEVLGGISLLIGFLSRFSAFILAIVLGYAALTIHSSVGFFMNWNGTLAGEGYEFHLLFIGLALVTMIRGSGAWSADVFIEG